MKCFFIRIEGIFFSIDVDGESTSVGFFSTFAIDADDDHAVREKLISDLRVRLAKNGVKPNNSGALKSFCWIDEYGEYSTPPDVRPDGFSFFRWRVTDLPRFMYLKARLRWKRSWRVLDFL